jgi:prepilin-type N-terminal cleavage/methylation domain-containing protein
MSINIFNKSRQKGFTLIEMIVSMAIFTVVAVIAVGALLKVMDANRKSLNLKTAINNLNFALESMSREMRVGGQYLLIKNNIETVTIDSNNYAYYDGITEFPGSEINISDWLIAFKSSKAVDSDCIIYSYRLYGGKLQKAQQSLNAGGSCDSITNDSYYDLISPDIKIIQSRVVVDNTAQPYVTFWFKGSIGSKEKDTTEFSIQTRVSQRISGFDGE